MNNASLVRDERCAAHSVWRRIPELKSPWLCWDSFDRGGHDHLSSSRGSASRALGPATSAAGPDSRPPESPRPPRAANPRGCPSKLWLLLAAHYTPGKVASPPPLSPPRQSAAEQLPRWRRPCCKPENYKSSVRSRNGALQDPVQNRAHRSPARDETLARGQPPP